LRAAAFRREDGVSYDNLTTYLGYPVVSGSMDADSVCLFYPLRKKQKNSYFVLPNDSIIAERFVIGKDYHALSSFIGSTLLIE
jgi:hypothetical protein